MNSLSKDEELFWENLKNRWWRLNNLYYIKDKHGKRVLFKVNWAQRELYDNLWFFNIVLKARQLGITTFFCILYLDQVLFSENKTAGIIAHKQDDARKFFRDKVKFAWDNLHPALKDNLGPPNTDSVGELSFPNGGRIYVSTSTRSGTAQLLHISEFGKLCATYPGKAEEVVTGSINTVEQGNFVSIESTAEGRDGYFYEFCQEAERRIKEGRGLNPLEFKFFFFPWWKHYEYRLKSTAIIPTELKEYFNNLRDKYGILLDDDQKRWYMTKQKLNGEKMFAEYPSTSEEAFFASIEGSYFINNMAKVYEERRIRNIPYDSKLLVNTYWDLGMNDSNIIIFTQGYGNEIRIINYYENNGEGLSHYVNILKDKKYLYDVHYLPHDVEVRNLDEHGKSRRQTLTELGLVNIRTVERTKDINDDIEAIRKIMSRVYFDEEKTKPLVDSLNNFRKEWDDRLGTWKNNPRHDKSSHAVSAMRLLARTWNQHSASDKKSKNTKFEDFF